MGCEDTIEQDPGVFSNTILFVSSDNAIIEASVFSLGDNEIMNYGAEISTTEDFESRQIVDLGERRALGKFVVQFSNLFVDQEYFVRPYIEANGNFYYGSILTFTTLPPVIEGVFPNVADVGNTVELRGSNIPPENFKIFIGDREANIEDVLFSSVVRFRIPKRGENVFEPVRFQYEDTIVTLDQPFEYVTGQWNLIDEWPVEINGFATELTSYFEAMYMQVGNELIFGLGYDQTQFNNSNVWSFNMETGEWSGVGFEENREVGARHPYKIGNSFGGGQIGKIFGTVTYNYTSWEYVNGEFVSTGPFPFDSYKGVGMNLFGTNYVFGGLLEANGQNIPENQLYTPLNIIYKEGDNGWENSGLTISELDVVEEDLPYFVINDIGYFVDENKETWNVDMRSNTWSRLSSLPSSINPYRGVNTTLEGKAYVGLFENSREMWEYDPETNFWKVKAQFPGDRNGSNVAIGSYNRRIFIVRNKTAVDFESIRRLAVPLQVWVFEPNGF